MKKYLLIASLGVLFGCSSKVGIAECDDFLEKTEKCASEQKMAIAQSSMKRMVEQLRTGWKENKPTAAECTKYLGEAKQNHAECSW
jgi:hypothetical protein